MTRIIIIVHPKVNTESWISSRSPSQQQIISTNLKDVRYISKIIDVENDRRIIIIAHPKVNTESWISSRSSSQQQVISTILRKINSHYSIIWRMEWLAPIEYHWKTIESNGQHWELDLISPSQQQIISFRWNVKVNTWQEDINYSTSSKPDHLTLPRIPNT